MYPIAEAMEATVANAPSKAKAGEATRAKVRFTNAQVYMTGAQPDQTFPTTDPADRAHTYKCADGLRPAAVRRRGKLIPTIPDGLATPRRYPACYLVGHNGHTVSFETAMEETAARERWLEENGLIGPSSSFASNVASAVAILQATKGNARARDRIRGGGK